MRHVLIALSFCAVAFSAYAGCQPPQPVTAFGFTFENGGFLNSLEAKENCDSRDQPAWLAKINDAPASKGVTPPGLLYCRQIAQSKEPQYEAQRRDCIFWYGHSIETP